MSDTAPKRLTRQNLNRDWMRLGILAALIAGAMTVKALADYERGFYISFNWTQSLPFFAFIVDEDAEPKIGDYIDFWPPENNYYEGISFVKQIVAGPGDELFCNGRSFFIDGVLIATAKEVSSAGDPLTMGPCGQVPEGHFFVVVPHKDSFDSRYGEIGYVPSSAIRGVASPVL